MNITFEKFASEIAADPGVSADCAEAVLDSLEGLFEEGNDSPDAQALTDCLTWIMRQPRSLIERVQAVESVLKLEGPVRINVREFLQW